MMASTSRAESTRYSSPWYLTSVPPYLLYSTTSPTLTSIGTRLAPASSKRPGPTARTSPSWGFSLAVSGITRPDAVVCSASSVRTTMRSSSGLRTTLVAVVTIRPPPADDQVLNVMRAARVDRLAGQHLGDRLLERGRDVGHRHGKPGLLPCLHPPGDRGLQAGERKVEGGVAVLPARERDRGAVPGPGGRIDRRAPREAHPQQARHLVLCLARCRLHRRPQRHRLA